MFISPHINSIENSAQRTLQNTSESPQQSLRVPIIKITPRFPVPLFVIGRECFHACGGYPYTWMREDTLYLLPENQSLSKLLYFHFVFPYRGAVKGVQMQGLIRAGKEQTVGVTVFVLFLLFLLTIT